MLAQYILFSLATLVLNLSGWLGVAYLFNRHRKLNILLSFSLGSLLFLVFFLLYGLILFYLNVFNRVTLIIPLLLLFPFAFKFIRMFNHETKTLLLLFTFQFLLGILLQLFIPYYPIGGDWFGHYQTSSSYITTGEITFVGGRPPVFNFLGAIYLEIFSDSFWVFQIMSAFLSSMLVIPIYLIAKNFHKKSAIITIVFVVLNPFILQNTIYTWPKSLTAYFVLFFLYFIIKNQTLLSTLPAALALYTSPISLFYIPAGYIYGYLKKNENLFKSIIILSLVFLPFAAYSVLKTGSGETTPFILYTIAVNGVERLIEDPPSKTFQDFLSTPFYHIIGIRLINVIMTSFPVLLFLKFLALFVELPIIYIQKTVVISQIPMIYHFMHSIPGSLSTLVYIFSMIGLYKLLKTNKEMLLLLIFPLAFGIIYWGWIKAGLINDLFHPTIPLLIMVAVSQMKSKKLIILSLSLMLIEGLIFAYFYNFQISFFINTTMSTNPEILSVDSINRVLSNLS